MSDVMRPHRRTRASIAAQRANGAKLARQNKAKADDFARRVAPDVGHLRQQHPTVRTLTAAMNAADVPTASGGIWHPATVHRLLKRLDRLNEPTKCRGCHMRDMTSVVLAVLLILTVIAYAVWG